MVGKQSIPRSVCSLQLRAPYRRSRKSSFDAAPSKGGEVYDIVNPRKVPRYYTPRKGFCTVNS